MRAEAIEKYSAANGGGIAARWSIGSPDRAAVPRGGNSRCYSAAKESPKSRRALAQ